MTRTRTLHVLIFTSADDTSIKIMEAPFVDTVSLKLKDLVGLIVVDSQHRGVKIDSDFDVLSFTSNRWLDPDEDIQMLPEEESTLILVSRAIKNKFGDEGSLYIARAAIYDAMKEHEKQDILFDIANSVKQLLNILEEMDNNTIEKVNEIITLKPNFMGIGVDLNRLFELLGKILKK